MEKKYQKMTRLEKLEVAKRYKNTRKGITLGTRLDRLVVWGLLAFACAASFIFIIFTTDPDKILKICLWILSGFMVVLGFVYIIWQHKIRMNEYNKFIESSDTYGSIRKNATPHKKRKK